MYTTALSSANRVFAVGWMVASLVALTPPYRGEVPLALRIVGCASPVYTAYLKAIERGCSRRDASSAKIVQAILGRCGM